MFKKSIFAATVLFMVTSGSYAQEKELDIVKEKVEQKKAVQMQLGELLHTIVETDPVIQTSKLQIQSNELELEKEMGNWLPTVDLTAYTGRELINSNDDQKPKWIFLKQN